MESKLLQRSTYCCDCSLGCVRRQPHVWVQNYSSCAAEAVCVHEENPILASILRAIVPTQYSYSAEASFEMGSFSFWKCYLRKC